MGCLSLNITLPHPALVEIERPAAPAVAIETTEPSSASVVVCQQTTVTVLKETGSTVAVNVVPQATVAIGEVCSVSDGELVVLATATDPLRTRDGGFILLDPETN